jgi:hypothetical protein
VEQTYLGSITTTSTTTTVVPTTTTTTTVAPYKIYAALLTQTSTTAPTAIELVNTIGTVTFQYITTGVYWIVSTGAFPILKTTVLSSNNITFSSNTVKFSVDVSNGRIIIHAFDDAGLPSDNLLIKQSIEIKVYN